MPTIKRLADYDDNIITVSCPVSNDELLSRASDYLKMSPEIFSKEYNSLLFTPAEFTLKDKTHSIQINFCNNPYCKWYGTNQEVLSATRKPLTKYKLSGKYSEKVIICNEDTAGDSIGTSLKCSSFCYSNWSVAEEIARLTKINSLVDIRTIYQFHKEGCTNNSYNPVDNKEIFYSRGFSSSKSAKFQCKECRKMTNVLPDTNVNSSYHKKKSYVLIEFAELLMSKTPVKKSCKKIGITPKTYYSKLEELYIKCLDFLERHETKKLSKMHFERMWINTDKLIYHINNIRKHGKSDKIYGQKVDGLRTDTQIVCSGEMNSNYIFRTDINYDFDTTLEKLNMDTTLYKEDHLQKFAQKNARLIPSFSPQPPTEFDDESLEDYKNNIEIHNRRGTYVDGLHVNSGYTTLAHLWLLKQSINADKWRFVSDDDNSITSSLYRIFLENFKDDSALHFTCNVEKNFTLQESFTKCQESKKLLTDWGISAGLVDEDMYSLGILYLCNILNNQNFYTYVLKNGVQYPKRSLKAIQHPIPSIDEGIRHINCTSNIEKYNTLHLARLIMMVNGHCTNTFFQEIRRTLTILERPLVTARGDGKSYIYSNFNPKYAQYAVTILRTYYNFCKTYKTADKIVETPAQRIGLANKVYTWNDILYHK